MTQSMAFSPYKKPFEERLMRWEAQLSLVSEVIDEWLALQRAWMYLEPIFSSPDILQQLPQEGKKYSSVDRIWRKVSKPSADMLSSAIKVKHAIRHFKALNPESCLSSPRFRVSLEWKLRLFMLMLQNTCAAALNVT